MKKKQVWKKSFAAAGSAALVLSMMACASLTGNTGAGALQTAAQQSVQIKETLVESADGISEVLEQDVSGMFTDRDLDWSYDESNSVRIALAQGGSTADSSAVLIDGNTVTITEEGVYVVTGTLKDGQIVVNVSDTEKVQIVLAEAQITNETGAAVYVKQADKVFLTLAEGTQNTLTNGGTYAAIDENDIDAVIFSKEDLTVNGSGSLTVTAKSGHGIVSKDDLKITGGTVSITAQSKGLSANDSVRITGETQISISSGTDGIHVENAEDAESGYLYIQSGTIRITSAADGIDAGSYITIEDAEITIQAGGGYRDASESGKGIKADGAILIYGGTYTLGTSDDALHSNGDLYIADGTFTITTGDDAVHADSSITVAGGTLAVPVSHEGIEGLTIDILGGTVDITADDDGINAAGGNDQSGYTGMFGQDAFAQDSDSYLRIAGGTVTVDSQGDGLDANGSLYITGGTVTVYGPVNEGNGALDYDGTAQITGGTLFASGTSGMAMNFREATQGSILLNTGNQNAGTTVTVLDGDGKEILSVTPQKAFASVLISAAELKEGETYTVRVGNTQTQITLDSLICGSGSGMPGGQGMPGSQGMPGGQGMTGGQGTPGGPGMRG